MPQDCVFFNDENNVAMLSPDAIHLFQRIPPPILQTINDVATGSALNDQLSQSQSLSLESTNGQIKSATASTILPKASIFQRRDSNDSVSSDSSSSSTSTSCSVSVTTGTMSSKLLHPIAATVGADMDDDASDSDGSEDEGDCEAGASAPIPMGDFNQSKVINLHDVDLAPQAMTKSTMDPSIPVRFQVLDCTHVLLVMSDGAFQLLACPDLLVSDEVSQQYQKPIMLLRVEAHRSLVRGVGVTSFVQCQWSAKLCGGLYLWEILTTGGDNCVFHWGLRRLNPCPTEDRSEESSLLVEGIEADLLGVRANVLSVGAARSDHFFMGRS